MYEIFTLSLLVVINDIISNNNIVISIIITLIRIRYFGNLRFNGNFISLHSHDCTV